MRPEEAEGKPKGLPEAHDASEWSGDTHSNVNVMLYSNTSTKDGPYSDTLAFHPSRILDLTKL